MKPSTPSPRKSIYRPDIDGLRAVAVMSVLFYHVGFEAFEGGYVGVDVFFVISGYLITRLIHQELVSGAFSFGKFYERRARRLFPALFFTWVVCLTAAFLLFSPEHFERFGGALLHSVLSVSNYFFWGESGYFDTDTIFKPLIHTWSLSVEEQFYFVWPALFYFLMTRTSGRMVPVFVFALGIASLYYSQRSLVTDPAGAFFLAPARVVEFAIGASMVWIGEFRIDNRSVLESFALIGLVLIAYSALEFSEKTAFPGFSALVPCLGTALLIYSGAAAKSAVLLNNPISVGVGLISYSLYLIHWPIIVFYQYYKFDVLSDFERTAICFISLVAAALMYRYVEQPFRLGKTKAVRFSPPAFGLTCALLALVVVFPAANIWANGGWDWRLGEKRNEAALLHPIKESITEFHRPLAKGVADGGARAFGLGAAPEDAEAKVLVIGDSHAEHLKHGLDYLGKKYGFTIDFYVATGCPPIFGAHKIYGQGGIANPPPRQELCKEQTRIWEDFIFRYQYDFVALSSRWAWLYESTYYERFRIRNDYLVDRENPVYTVAASRKTFQKQLKYTVDTILSSGAKAIIFSQVPNHGKNPEGCDNVPKYIINAGRLNARCSGVSRKTATERLAFTDATVTALAGQKGVFAVVPSRYFCPAGATACLAFSGNTRMYTDADHVNPSGSMFLARAWEDDPAFPLRIHE